MSEEPSEPKPSKLKLSSSLSRASDNTSAEHTGLKPAKLTPDAQLNQATQTKEQPAAQPKRMRLKPAKPLADAQPTETAKREDTAAPQPEKMRLKPAKPLVDAQPTETAKREDTTPPQPKKVSLKPAKPLADVQPTETTKRVDKPAPQPEKVSLKPPELPSQQTPAINNDTADKVDETIQRLPQPPNRSNPLISILIIAVLLLILSAAAAGIWYLLKSDKQNPSEEQPAASAPAPTPAPTPAPAPVVSAPIATTPKVIRKMPVADLTETKDDAIADNTPVPLPQVVTVPVPQARTVPESELTPMPASEAVQLNAQVKQAASQYLQNAHIGALRTGPQARVMLNGINYAVNDVVDSNTGLIFLGTRDQRLVFKDRNGILYVKSF